MRIPWGPQLDPWESKGGSFSEGPMFSLEGPASSLKVGQDGAPMVHMASPRAVFCLLPCLCNLIPLSRLC